MSVRQRADEPEAAPLLRPRGDCILGDRRVANENRETPSPIADLLRNTSVFHEVDLAVLEKIASRTVSRTYDRDQTIFEIGSASDGIYVIRNGRVGISNLFADGKEIILNILEKNDVFGEVGAIDGLPRTASAVAMEDTSLLHLDAVVFRTLIKDHPTLSYGFMSVLCSRIRWTSDLIEDTVFRDTRTRLARRLLMLADLYGMQTEDGVRINIKISQDHLGRMLGVSRESISKEGSYMKYRHAVSFKHGVITIHDRKYLENLASLS